MKLVAIDMDGTLLRRDGSVEEADRRALAWLGERGVAVALVTGRLWSGACEVAAELGLSGPMGCVDGSHIVALDGADLQRRAIPADDARRIRALLGARGASLFRLAADGITYEPDGDRFAAYVSIWSPRIRRVDDHGVDPAWTDPDGVLGMVAVGREAMLREASQELERELGPTLALAAFGAPGLDGHAALLVRAHGPTKGTAIAWLAEHHGATVDEVVAIGDWWNDIPMFAVAGRSFVMRGAPEAVAETATDRLDAEAGKGGGVAELVARVFGVDGFNAR